MAEREGKKTQLGTNCLDHAGQLESRRTEMAFPPVFVVCFLVGKVGRLCFLHEIMHEICLQSAEQGNCKWGRGSLISRWSLERQGIQPGTASQMASGTGALTLTIHESRYSPKLTLYPQKLVINLGKILRIFLTMYLSIWCLAKMLTRMGHIPTW